MWLTALEAAAYCRVCVRTFRDRVKAGRLPAGKAISVRRKVWSKSDLDTAIAGATATHLDPIMAAIHAAEKDAAARRAHAGQGSDLLVREDPRPAPRAAAR